MAHPIVNPDDPATDLTKREWMASMALQGLCSKQDNQAPKNAGQWAAAYADALITALNNPLPPEFTNIS